MDMKKIKEFLKKAFGKEKDSRVHAIVMLCIYAVFMLLLVLFIRTGNNNIEQENNKTNNNEEIKEKLEENDEEDDSDINYTYSYIINHDDQKETYLGSRINNKQKFTYVKDDESIEYAIIGDNYLIKKDDGFHVTDKLTGYFKYCDMEKILELLEKYGEENEENKYSVKTRNISSKFKDSVNTDCGDSTNTIEVIVDGDDLKEVTMDLDNYASCIEGGNHTLNIKMEFTSIGTTSDFEIKIN